MERHLTLVLACRRGVRRGVAAALALALTALAATALPREITNPLDSSRLVLIPGGTFAMGSPAGRGDPDEHPRHPVRVGSFYLGRCLVTNAQFARFLTASAPGPRPFASLRGASVRPTEISLVEGRYLPTPGFEDHPVLGVSWEGAQAYCAWAGLRLPTEAEWEYAAAGGLASSRYPWGDAPPEGRSTYGREWPDGRSPAPTTRVGSHAPNGFGLYDMVGNATQWTSSAYASYPYVTSDGREEPGSSRHGLLRVARGGGWHADADGLRLARRLAYPPRSTGSYFRATGFRCAKSATGAVPLK